MKIGYRVFKRDDISKFDADFVQVSIWHKKPSDVAKIAAICEELRDQGIAHVIHVLGLYLSDTRPQREEALAALTDYAGMCHSLILHDETLPNGDMLTGPWRANYEAGLKELKGICNVSLENSSDSHNALWFWEEFADSITFDIGHFVSAGIDVIKVIKSLSDNHLAKLDYVHVHKHNGLKPGGITDHWALQDGCVELLSLEELLKRKKDLKVIVEVDGDEDLRRSIELVEALKG